MPLDETQVDYQERKEAGRQSALAAGATEPKPVGDTSATNYPYTYWFVVGWNEVIAEQQK